MNKKAYTFGLILYKDSLTYDYEKIIHYIEKYWKHYAYIEHDEDLETKKPHTHVLVHFDNKRYLYAVAKELGIAPNYIQKVNLVPYLRYLIHFDDEDKKQYSVSDVHGTLVQRLQDVISSDSLTETEQVSIICDYIFEYESWLYHSVLVQFVLKTGCYSAYRRNFTMFNQLLLEHNSNL